MPAPLFDTSVWLRHLTNDNSLMSPRATALVRRIEVGDVSVRLTDQVVFETGFTLERWYKATKAEVSDLLLPFIQLPSVILPGKDRWGPTFDLYASSKLSLVDAFHVIEMQDLGITEIISFDTDFDAIPGITRTEP